MRGRNIEIFFSPKFGELCWSDMETFGPFGGKFLEGESSIDQMKQIPGIRGILHQLKLVAFWETQSLKQSPRVVHKSRLRDRMTVKTEYNQGICPLLSCISPHFVGDILYFGSAPITLFCWQNKRKRALGAASNKGPQRQSDSVKNLTTDPCSDHLCFQSTALSYSAVRSAMHYSAAAAAVHLWVWRAEWGGVGTAQ